MSPDKLFKVQLHRLRNGVSLAVAQVLSGHAGTISGLDFEQQ
jgi:hypothetical protein